MSKEEPYGTPANQTTKSQARVPPSVRDNPGNRTTPSSTRQLDLNVPNPINRNRSPPRIAPLLAPSRIKTMNTTINWELSGEKIVVYRIPSVDIAEKVHDNTQAAAKSKASDLNKLLNHGNDTVPVSVNTGAVTSWLSKLVAQEGIVVLKKQRIADNETVRVSGETDPFSMVYPNDTAVLFDALDALVPLAVETDEISHARIEAHMSRNMAIGDGVRLDALNRAVPPSALHRPYEAHGWQ